jgi:hypothetical protein
LQQLIDLRFCRWLNTALLQADMTLLSSDLQRHLASFQFSTSPEASPLCNLMAVQPAKSARSPSSTEGFAVAAVDRQGHRNKDEWGKRKVGLGKERIFHRYSVRSQTAPLFLPDDQTTPSP